MVKCLLAEEESRTQGSRPRTQKNPRPRPRTALSRKDPPEAKDRNVRGQGQRPRTQAQVFSKKKGSSKIFFRRPPKKRSSRNFFRLSPVKNVFQNFFQAIYKISTIQNKVLSSSRRQGSFGGLKASRPRPRT